MAMRAAAGKAPAGAEPPASAKEMAALEAHLDAVMTRVGFMHADNALQLAPRVHRILARASPDDAEVRILRGLLAAIDRRTGPGERPVAADAIYLDHAATAPLEPEAAEAMRACLADPLLQGNPASAHAAGRRAAAIVEAARAEVAALVQAPAESIVFTSGATESVNLAILGAARAAPRGSRHVVSSRVEHRAGIDACRQLEREGFRVTWLAPRADGAIAATDLAAALTAETALVSLMHANNETGVLNDVAAFAALCNERGIPLHVDAAQSAGRIPVDAVAGGSALLSFCAHKLGGPKGIGALYVRRRPRPALQPLQFGGGHESGLRSGTLPTHPVAGFGAACRRARAGLESEGDRIRALRERLWRALQAAAPIWRNGAAEPTVPGILNVGFAGIEGESLLL